MELFPKAGAKVAAMLRAELEKNYGGRPMEILQRLLGERGMVWTEFRRKLVVSTYQALANGRENFNSEQDADILDAYPAWELTSVEKPELYDWSSRWQSCGGRVFDGRMIALKNSPIWAQLSLFQYPWPPFAPLSGMGLDDIDRGTAEECSLLGFDDYVKPARKIRAKIPLFYFDAFPPGDPEGEIASMAVAALESAR